MINYPLHQALSLTGVKYLLSIGVTVLGIINVSSPALAAFMYDETSDPPLSTDRFNPTFVGAVMAGTTSTIKIVIANLPPNDNNPTIPDRNYFTITVPEGLALTQLILADYIPGDDVAFIGLQRGTQFTVPPNTPNANELLGYTLVGIANFASVNKVGDNLLPLMGLTGTRPLLPPPRNTAPAPDPIGFIPPLLAGDYVFWVQQTTFTPNPTQLQLNFIAAIVPATVPEPSSVLGLLALGTLGVGLARKNKD